MQINLRPFFMLLGVLISALPSFATNYYWVATSAGDWKTAGNWSLQSGGAGGNGSDPGNGILGYPVSGDVAIFDENSQADCTISSSVTVGEIRVDIFSDYNNTGD